MSFVQVFADDLAFEAVIRKQQKMSHSSGQMMSIGTTADTPTR